MKKKSAIIFLAVMALFMFAVVAVCAVDKTNVQQKQEQKIEKKEMKQGGGDGDQITQWDRYLQSLGWAVVAAIGFSFGIGIGIKVFDLLSTKIDEWEEIKKGNWGVAMIITSIIVMVGLIVIKVI